MKNIYTDAGTAITYTKDGATVVVPKHPDYAEFIDFQAQSALRDANAAALDLLASGGAVPDDLIAHRNALKNICADPVARTAIPVLDLEAVAVEASIKR